MNELRQRLRRAKVTQAELSHHCGVPPSTLKKWFVARDGAMSRIHVICAALDVKLSEILKAIEMESVKTFKMGDAQQAFFASDMRTFQIYWLFVYERQPLKEIQTLLEIGDRDFEKRLFKLDRLNLMRYIDADRAKAPRANPVRWSSDGPFMQRLLANWSEDLAREAILNQAGSIFMLQYFQLTEDSEKELRRDLANLEEKYARRTVQELRLKTAKTGKLRVLISAAPGSFVKPDRRVPSQ